MAVAGVGSVLLALHATAAWQPLAFEPRGTRLQGHQFQYDGGFEVGDWNHDGLPDVYVYETSSNGRGNYYFNSGEPGRPRFTHGIWERLNSTETAPQTVEHLSARAYGDLNGDGLTDAVFYDGQLRYAPNSGTLRVNNFWNLWTQTPEHFPGSPRMIRENARYVTGPESMFWKSGVFARQVATFTLADWDGDGLLDLLICRFEAEAPGVDSLGLPDHWGNWGRHVKTVPRTVPAAPAEGDAFLKPLSAAPARGLYFYRNVGSATAPYFDEGIAITTADGAPVVAPNPVVFDVDGDGVPDVVATEVPYHSNAFRVDWPTTPHVVWFRRPRADDSGRLEAGRPLTDVTGAAIPAGTMVRFADLGRPGGTADLLVLDGGDRGTLRWYPRGKAANGTLVIGAKPLTFGAQDFFRQEFSVQPVVVDWFAPGSRDLILHGIIDHHCKFGLRRTALYRNQARSPGPPSYRFVGWLTLNGDPALAPVAAEERPYECFTTAISVAVDHATGQRRIMLSLGGQLFYFTDLAEDGLTFRRMQRPDIGRRTARMRGWQEHAIDVPFAVRHIRLNNDRNGMGNLRDSFLHVMHFEALSGGANVAVTGRVSVTRTHDETVPWYQIQQPERMFDPTNAPGDFALHATSFGYFIEAAHITLDPPARLDRIRFQLSDRDTLWYEFLAPFAWQGRLIRMGHGPEDLWYHYRLQVSEDGTQWVDVADRREEEMFACTPVLVDWNGDGVLDLLLGYTGADGIYPNRKRYRLYLNEGDDAHPRYAAPLPLTDAEGQPLNLQAQWTSNTDNQSGVVARDLDGDGRLDLVVEGLNNNALLLLRNISEGPLPELRFAAPEPLHAGAWPLEYAQWRRFFTLADVDGDGQLDLVNANDGTPYWFRGVADGSVAGDAAARSDEGGVRVYAAAAGALDAAAPEKADGEPPRVLEVRAPSGGWGQKPGVDQKMALLRFNGLPVDAFKRAELALRVDRRAQASPTSWIGPSDFLLSANVVGGDWEAETVCWAAPRTGDHWPDGLLDRGGDFIAFAAAIRDVQPATTMRWDVTKAVRAAQAEGRDSLDLLVRLDYTGHYVAGEGFVFCGPGWDALEDRPHLLFE